MIDGHSLNNSAKKDYVKYNYQKVGKPIRVGNLNCQYYRDSNGNLIRTSRQIFQKVDTDNEAK